MNSDLTKIKQEAWVWVNRARKAVGLQPILFFPASTRNSEDHCVIASTIPLHPNQRERELIAEAWQTQVLSESELPPCDETYYVHYPEDDWITVPEAVTQFRNLFNEGHYPELEV